jgi:hypothetical protein
MSSVDRIKLPSSGTQRVAGKNAVKIRNSRFNRKPP